MHLPSIEELILCDPTKNTECPKTMCHINGGLCRHTTKEEYRMEHELRYYLNGIKEAIKNGDFTPTYFVTAVKLPTGAIELAVNTSSITEKIDYILEAYNDDMCLKTNTEVQMSNLMVV